MPVAGAKYAPTMCVTVYELARDGLSDKQIAKTLGVAQQTFYAWAKKHPELTDAVTRGRAKNDPKATLTLQGYIYNKLPGHLRELWDKINECEDLDSGVERIEALLANQGTRARQHLFIFALTQSMFNVSKSLAKLNISRKTFDYWCSSDPDFSELVDEIHWHKKNFIENKFLRLVNSGDSYATVFAVKTQLRDRGYGEKIDVNHTGTVTHKHTVSVADLDLSLAVRQAILEAYRRYKAAHAQNNPADAKPAQLAPTGPVMANPVAEV